MNRSIVACVVALMCAGGTAGARDDTSSQAADVVAARRAAFEMSAVTVNAIGTGLGSNAELRSLAFPATALANWGDALPSMFPAGTGLDSLPGGTRAKAEIWTDRAGFEAQAEEYRGATARLRDAVAAGDAALAATEFASVRATCGSCHSAYRE